MFTQASESAFLLRILCEEEDKGYGTINMKILFPSENGLYGPKINRLV